MATKQRLNDRMIHGLKPAPRGKRLELWDALVPGFGVRVTDKGAKSYVVYTRWPGTGAPARRAIGGVDRLPLAEARKKAREWLELVAQGRDPAELARQAREAENERRGLTFGAVMEKFIARHVRKLRKARDMEREIRAELMPRWAKRPISEITRKDVARMVGEIRDRGALYQAHHLLGHTRKFFNWAIGQEEFGIETSPCERLRPKELIGEKRHRDRTLDDDEIRALWRTAGRLGYPMGALYRMLLLTGQRKSEVSGARWREFDLKARLWTIPSERFKSNAVHLVPLNDGVVTLLAELPRWPGGDYLFSTTGGDKPVNGFSKAKARLDAMMAEELGAAPERGFVIHDIRRTVRTRLSQLKVEERVAEKVIGHAARGIGKVYDQWEFLDERREALDAWAARLRSIVEPPPANVVSIERVRA